jgi:probable HAF family extracellular repeat protein
VFAVSAAAAAAMLPTDARAATPGITAVGASTTRPSSSATDVSGDGSAVVGDSTGDGSNYAAYRWTAGGGTVPLDGFRAAGVSGDGSVIAGSQNFVGGQAVRWTQATGAIPLGAGATDASGISEDGSVIVGLGYDASNVAHAYRWTQQTGVTPLGDLPGGWDTSIAIGVSGDGAVAVGYSTSTSGQEAFRWTPGGGMAGLGDLPGGNFESGAYGANHDGSVVVGYGSSADAQEAFAWRESTGMVGLGFLPTAAPFTTFSGAEDVSDDGSVIVGFSSSSLAVDDPIDFYTEAFVWTPGSGMVRLWDVLEAAGVDPAASGWTSLVTAKGVSDDGRTIAGYGVRNGVITGFVAVIPEPGSTMVLAASAALGLTRLRRRCTLRP